MMRSRLCRKLQRALQAWSGIELRLIWAHATFEGAQKARCVGVQPWEWELRSAWGDGSLGQRLLRTLECECLMLYGLG